MSGRKGKIDTGCEDFFKGAVIVGLLFAVSCGVLAAIGFSWLTHGKVADRWDVHRYCMRLTDTNCRGFASGSNLAGDGFIMLDLANGYLKHRFLLDNPDDDVIEEITINGPRTLDDPEIAATYIPGDGTSLNVTVNDLGFNLGSYKLKTADRDDRAFAEALVKNPYLFYVLVKTTADPDGAICGEILSECRPAYDYDKHDYP